MRLNTKLNAIGRPPGREDQGPRTGEIEDLIGEEWGFEPDVLFDALPSGGVAFSDSSAYVIKLTDPSGAVFRVLRRPIRPMLVTEEMRRAERERLLEAQRNRQVTQIGEEPPPEVLELLNRMRAAWLAEVENMQFFPEVPVIAAVRATWGGALWIQRTTAPGWKNPVRLTCSRRTGATWARSPRGYPKCRTPSARTASSPSSKRTSSTFRSSP